MPMIVEECAAKDCAVQKSVNCEMSLKSSQVDTFLPSERQLMITENGKATQGNLYNCYTYLSPFI